MSLRASANDSLLGFFEPGAGARLAHSGLRHAIMHDGGAARGVLHDTVHASQRRARADDRLGLRRPNHPDDADHVFFASKLRQLAIALHELTIIASHDSLTTCLNRGAPSLRWWTPISGRSTSRTLCAAA
jgi:hypothetical protein